MPISNESFDQRRVIINTIQRYEPIVGQLTKLGAATPIELALKVGLTPDVVRKALSELFQAGVLRVRVGQTPSSSSSNTPPFKGISSLAESDEIGENPVYQLSKKGREVIYGHNR